MSKREYCQYKTGQSYISIPKSIAESIGWKHKDEISIETKMIDGKMGLFLYKAGAS